MLSAWFRDFFGHDGADGEDPFDAIDAVFDEWMAGIDSEFFGREADEEEE